MANILENQLAGITQVIEKQLDEQLERFDNLDKDDLKTLREQRLREMKEYNGKKQEWLKNVSNGVQVIDFFLFFYIKFTFKNYLYYHPTCFLIASYGKDFISVLFFSANLCSMFYFQYII